MVSRTDRSAFSEWWWTVDRYLLVVLVGLMVGGVVLSLAGSPPVAERLGLDSFHFAKRHIAFFLPSVVLMIAVSFLTPRQVRRVSLIVFVTMVVLMLATLFVGDEIKGARRWITVGAFSLQASEFAKPAFVVLTAWLFAEAGRQTDIPANLFAVLLLAIVGALLVAQPDFGQTLLVAIAWGALFFLSGVSWRWIVGVLGVAAAGIAAAYSTMPHVAMRIDRFLNPQGGDTYQIDTALNSFLAGGWFGQGPGEGVVKRVLPDSHTDFIFAVAAEEFGIVVCLLLVAAFAFVVVRGFSYSLKDEDPFTRLAVAGLTILFGVQSVINMAVNLNLMPAKGMTLPFISYGGSSMLALGLQMGFLLALTRHRRQRFQPADRFVYPAGWRAG
jgi:cell division protein FtsW